MSGGFKRMMTALWQETALGDPVWSDERTALLHLEGQTVEMRLSDDGGYVLASVDIAPLAKHHGRRRAEMDVLLKYNLLSLMVNSGAVCFDDRADTTYAVARGLCPCELGLTDRLSKAIVDLVYLRDECLRLLAQEQTLEAPPSDDVSIVSAGSFIFKP